MKEKKDISHLVASQLQEELISVYWALPRREAVTPPSFKYEELIKEEIDQLPGLSARRRKKREKGELLRIKKGLLRQLLSVSEITSTFREAIEDLFDRDFKHGIGFVDPVYEILHITDETPFPEGIFSTNRNKRMIIERKFYEYKLKELQALKEGRELDRHLNPENPAFFQRQISEQEAFLSVFRDDFADLYGESVTSLQESPKD